MKATGIMIIAAAGVLFSMLSPRDDTFRHESLKGKSDEEIDRFMGGKPTQDHFNKETQTPNSFPADQWLKDPREAAIAFVQANRNVSGRPGSEDDSFKAPESGWIVHDWTSSGCYSLSTSITTLRFGVDRPFIFRSWTNHNGVVGRNPFADRIGRTLDIIELSPEEARFIAGVISHLNHFRSRREEDRFNMPGISSTADGSGVIDLHPAGKPSVRIQGCVWAGRSIHDSWEGPFHDEALVNLIDYFLTEAVPFQLGKRWPQRGSDYRNFVTPMEERVKPRADSDILDEYSATVNLALEKHQSDPWPAAAVESLVSGAGDLGLDKTRFNINRLAKSLSPATDREKRLRELEKEEWERLMRREPGMDPFDKPRPEADAKKQEEKRNLAQEFRYDLATVIREPLRMAIQQIDAIHDAEKLAALAEKENETSVWALQQLQTHHPKIYSRLMISRFQRSGDQERSMLFNTLVAASPEAADELRETLSIEDQKSLVIELAEFELGRHPAAAATRTPILLEIVADEEDKRDWSTRDPAISLLSRLPLDDLARGNFENLLIREMENPRRSGFHTSVLGSVYEAIGRLPDPQRHWDTLIASAEHATEFSEFESLLHPLALIVRKDPDKFRKEFVDLLKRRMVSTKGMMNDLFETALAMDLRELSPEILALASTGPDVPDGKGANSWGGDFTGPGSIHRYHAARHVTALWQESDSETLAKMWTSLVLHQPHEFNRSLFISDELTQRCREAFGKISPPLKASLISRIREKQPAYANLAALLEK